MRSILHVSILALIALLAAGVAQAQATAQQNPVLPMPPVGYGAPVSLATAKKITVAAMAEADRIGVPMVVAITDPAGALIYLEKNDIAIAGGVTVAPAKARSAALYKRPTKAFEDALAAGGAGMRILGWTASIILAARVASRRNVTRRDVVVSADPLVVEGCGHVGEGCGGGQRIALSTAVPGAPQAHRPHVHSPPGAQRPAPARACRGGHVSAGASVAFLSCPRIRSFAFSARQALMRRCSVRSCALLA